MGEELTQLQVSALYNHNHLCKQSFLGFKNNFLLVRSFNLYLIVEVSKDREILLLADPIRDAVL